MEIGELSRRQERCLSGHDPLGRSSKRLQCVARHRCLQFSEIYKIFEQLDQGVHTDKVLSYAAVLSGGRAADKIALVGWWPRRVGLN